MSSGPVRGVELHGGPVGNNPSPHVQRERRGEGRDEVERPVTASDRDPLLGERPVGDVLMQGRPRCRERVAHIKREAALDAREGDEAVRVVGDAPALGAGGV